LKGYFTYSLHSKPCTPQAAVSIVQQPAWIRRKD